MISVFREMQRRLRTDPEVLEVEHSVGGLRLREDEFRRASFRVTDVPDAEMRTGPRTSPQT